MKKKIKEIHKKIKARIDASKHRRKIYLALLTAVILLITSAIYFYIFYQLPSPTSLKEYKVIPLSTHILDRNGRLLYEIYKDEKRTLVKVKDLPNHVKQATIAIEDKSF